MSKEAAYIYLQEGEGHGAAECGCRIALNFTGSPMFFQCPMHTRAPEYAAALHFISATVEVMREEGSLSPFIKALVGLIEGVIDKAQG